MADTRMLELTFLTRIQENCQSVVKSTDSGSMVVSDESEQKLTINGQSICAFRVGGAMIYRSCVTIGWQSNGVRKSATYGKTDPSTR